MPDQRKFAASTSITRSSATAARLSRCSRAAGAPARRCARSRRRSPRPATASSSTTGAIPAPPASQSRASSENDEWAEDLHELLGRLDALPAFIGGSSSGCRLAMILALRRPEDVRGLLLWRVTGGAHAAERLTNQYYTSHIEAAQQGGMAAVCRLDHWTEVIGVNPKARDALMGMDPQDFIARMTRWRTSFLAGTEHPVIGLSPAELRGMTMPACIAPGSDPVHPRTAGQAAHRLMPNAEYHQVRDRRPPGHRDRLRRLGQEGRPARGDLHRLHPPPAPLAVTAILIQKVPAQAGTHFSAGRVPAEWIPACAGIMYGEPARRRRRPAARGTRPAPARWRRGGARPSTRSRRDRSAAA